MHDYMITYIGYRTLKGENPIVVNHFVKTELDAPTVPWLVDTGDFIRKSYHFARGVILNIVKLS